MAPNKTSIMTIELSDGETIHVQYTPTGRESATLRTFSFTGVTKKIRALAVDLRSALQPARPTRTTVEFGISFAALSGGPVALLVKGEEEASLKIKLEWETPPQGE